MSVFRLDMKFFVILIVSLLFQGYRIFENNIWVIWMLSPSSKNTELPNFIIMTYWEMKNKSNT